ncbi:MAG: ABC transporter ATP-binding protein [Malacoplasma sp.]
MNENFIEIKNIFKKYDDNFVAIKNINLVIKKGEFITMLGPSGCGKTTLLKMLGGFEMPTSGKILVRKIDIKDLPIQRRPTATVFQDYALFPNMNVEKNISYGLKEIRKPLENIDPKLLKNKDKLIEESTKKANSKIKEIMKKKEDIKKEIKKIEDKISSDEKLASLFKMSKEELDIEVSNIKRSHLTNEQRQLLNSIPFHIKLIELVNNMLFFLFIPVSIKYKIKENEKIVKDYLIFKRKYRELNSVKSNLEKLYYEFNDLDYWISYWQNFKDQELDWYEKRNLTRKITQQEINLEVNKIIKLVGLEEKNKKYPHELSGGMQQRVALARAIIIKPDILLLDEPLSALDAQVRKNMQHELKRLHNELGITFILVTHDQEEALTLSDKVVVMSHGEIQQVGAPMEIYDKPKNSWVANFIGKANIFDAKYLNSKSVLINGVKFQIDIDDKCFTKNQNIKALIRPEDFDVVKKDCGNINVKIKEIIYKGLLWELICDWNGKVINIENIDKVNVNQEVGIMWDIDDMHLMEK